MTENLKGLLYFLNFEMDRLSKIKMGGSIKKILYISRKIKILRLKNV